MNSLYKLTFTITLYLSLLEVIKKANKKILIKKRKTVINCFL